MPLGKVKPHLALRHVYPLPDPVTWWYVALSKYFERRISFQGDLLPAIAGVAEKVAERKATSMLVGYGGRIYTEDYYCRDRSARRGRTRQLPRRGVGHQ
jgi:hypothetical protein